MRLSEFLSIYNSYGKDLPLALNIKADGLQQSLKQLLEQFKITNYFVFDMSIPDQLHYHKLGFRVFTRQSEYETTPMLFSESQGVWMDQFLTHWVQTSTIRQILERNKQVCIVSPELHGRSYLKEWNEYKKAKLELSEQFMLCTDHPVEATHFFKEVTRYDQN